MKKAPDSYGRPVGRPRKETVRFTKRCTPSEKEMLENYYKFISIKVKL